MTKLEMAQIMAVLRVAYPSYYRGVSEGDAASTVALWTDIFRDEAPEVVAAAVKALIATREEGYPPTIGAVRAQVMKLKNNYGAGELDALGAWAMVRRAIGRGIYNAQEEFDKLPEAVQRCVGSPNQIKDWAEMNSETVDSVVASNFQRAYRVRAEKAAEYAMLPPGVKQVAAALAERLELAAHKEG